MKYLIVDDDNVFCERFVLSLRRRGHESFGASGASEGRELAKSNAPERAVLDLRMPGSTGLELISWLKTDNPSLPIVVLTGYGSIATTQDAIRRGALSYLTKPCSLDRVIEAFEPQGRLDSVTLPIPTLDQVEWEHLQRVLADCDGNVTPLHRRIVEALPKGSKPSDYITSLDITATKT